MSDDLYQFVSSLWEHKPTIVILFCGGLMLFLLSVINTFRHRRRRKRQYPTSKSH